MHSSASTKKHFKTCETSPLNTKRGDQGYSTSFTPWLGSIGKFLPARDPVEPVNISQENGHPTPPLLATGAKRQRT